MNNNHFNRLLHSKEPDPRTHYKVTRTFTDSDGKVHTETIEAIDGEALKLMRNMHIHHDHLSRIHRYPNNMSQTTPVKRSMVMQNNDEFVREALKIHNDLRRKHGVEPLQLNNDLSKLAQQWANHLASTNTFTHSKTKYRHSQVGENLYCQSQPITGKEMTEAWYNEHRKYDYDNRHTYQSGTGHFTQIVWKNTQEVGFAQVQGSSMYYTVAMYYPAGNYLGEYDKNVYPCN